MKRIPHWLCVVFAACCLLAVGDAQAAESKTWRLLSSSPPFPPTISIPMGVLDPVRGRVLVVDAEISARPIVVHVFDPVPEPHWYTLAAADSAPAQRYLVGVVYDPVRDRLLVIGSYDAQVLDVWALTLSSTPAWEKLATSNDPPRRYGHSTVYDPVHDLVVMFGGQGGSFPPDWLSEVWTLSLASGIWSQLAPSGIAPVGREGHGALYEPGRQRMVVFGGRYDDVNDGTHHFLNDLWELSLGDSATWSRIEAEGTIPGARSAFGTVYDPLRRRMLVHGGVNPQGGVEPDELWALSLDDQLVWTQIVTEDTLRGRSYPVDVYDPAGDRLLACGGARYPQTSALSLSNPIRWEAVLPPHPLLNPGARTGHAAVHDTRRERLLVVGGNYSVVDSAMWSFDLGGTSRWRPLSAAGAPRIGFDFDHSTSVVYDSLGDRVILFDGWQVYSLPVEGPRNWTALGPRAPRAGSDLGARAGIALDTRRNRLILSGGWIYYPHSAGYTVSAVWALSLGPDPSWSLLGRLPQTYGSAGHASYYDPVQDRLLLLGGFELMDSPRTYRPFGATVWASPLDSSLHWTLCRAAGPATPPAPPVAQSTHDPRLGRLFVARDSTVWTCAVNDTGPWMELEFSAERPTVTSAIAYDPVEDQLLALFAAPPGTSDVQAWAVAVGPLSLSWLGADRTPNAIELRCRSVTAYGRAAVVERREESTDWAELGPLALDVEGLAAFMDHDVQAGHDYWYRVSVSDDGSVWHSDPIFVPDPGSLRLALLGARPQPAIGSIRMSFSLPANGPAQLEIFDLHGRRYLSREVGTLGPGIHSIRLPESATWRPGVYYARLQRGGDSRTSHIVLMR